MILDIVVEKTDDGCNAEIPSLKGCECWAHDEETVIERIIELASYYLKTEKDKFKIDKAHGNKYKVIYKLVFDKK